MKKVILSLVMVAALTVVSCKEKEAEVTEETTEVVEEVAAPVEEAVEVVDSAATEAPATDAPAETPAK